MVYEKNEVDAIKNCDIPCILHGTFDINDFDYAGDFVNLLLNLQKTIDFY